MASQIPAKAVAAITDAKGAMASARVLITTFAERQAAAIAQALQNGASAEELQPLQDVHDSFVAEREALAAAVAANP